MATFTGGFPPGPDAGNISPKTTMLRPRMTLSDEQCSDARRLRRTGKTIEEIASTLSVHVEDVRLALAAMRTRRRAPTRAALNVTIAARDFVAAEGEPGEVTWQTVERLLGELTLRRALATGTRH